MCSQQPSLDVIHEVDECEMTSPSQVPASSSPCLCGVADCPQCNPDSNSSSYSRFSRTSISECPQDLVSSHEHSPAQEEDRADAFVKNLCGRLMKLSRERELLSNVGHLSRLESPNTSKLRGSSHSFDRTPLAVSHISKLSSGDPQYLNSYFKRARSERFKLRTQAPEETLPSATRVTSSAKRSFSIADLYSHKGPADARLRDLFPQSKKRRLPTRSSTLDKERFATQTASARRARSLRNDADECSVPLDPQNTKTIENLDSPSSCKERPPGWVSTVPCSPQPRLRSEEGSDGDFKLFPGPEHLRLISISPLKLSTGVSSEASNNTIGMAKKNKRAVVKAIPFDVPIIAPPRDHAWRPPLSEEAKAKTSLLRFKEREQKMRSADGILTNSADEASYGRSQERKAAAEFVQYEFVYESVSQVMACVSESEDEEDGVDSDEDVEMEDAESDVGGEGESSIFKCFSRQRSGWADISVEDREIIGWILQAFPAVENSSPRSSPQSGQVSARSNASDSTRTSFNSPYYSSSHSSSSSSSFSPHMSCGAYPCVSSDGLEDGRWNLMDQLLHSPETRFHAAYLFRRFFRVVFGPTGDRLSGAESQLAAFARKFSWDIEGCEMITWDVAVACVALSVKMHRDFLPPLFPIRALEYEELAPHDMSYGDLEAAQRDVLYALSYNVGSTPQAVLDDLWTALPSLRELLDFRDGGWSLVQQETWEILFMVVVEPEIMEFPLSLLTVAALVEALVLSLVRKYEGCDPWYYEFLRSRGRVVGGSCLSEIGEGRPGGVVAGVPMRTRPGCDQEGIERVLERAKKERVRKAKMECEGVVLDIQAVMGIADGPLETCRKWIEGVCVKSRGK